MTTDQGTERRGALLATMAENQRVAELSPSPFYATLVERMAADVRHGGPTWDLLEPHALEPSGEYFPFRVLAGVHLEVLAGERPDLARHYPSVGGDGDAGAAWPGVRDAIAGQDPDVVAELGHPLQTNETSRCGALIGGLCEVAHTTGLPLRILELGSSAGLNLHLDRYRYEADGMALGPADSRVRFVDYWYPTSPRLDADLRIVERRGCDLSPIDPLIERGALELEACLWPDQQDRLETLRAAVTIAREEPVAVDQASAERWVAEQLQPASASASASADAGLATVVFHSVFWPYPPDQVRSQITAAIEAAGSSASRSAPLAWLRYEEAADEPTTVELRLRSWPGGTDRLLGTGRFHPHPVHWVATPER